MIRDRDIIVISLQSWDIGIGSNCRDIAKEFSKHNRVLFVNSPLDRMSRWKNRNQPEVKKRLDVIRGKEEDLSLVSNNLWVLNPRTTLESVSRLPADWLFDRLNYLNNLRFARQIISAACRLKFSDYILFNDGNMYRGFYLKEMIRPRLSVYYYRDNFMAMDFWKVQGRRIQPALLAKSDLVLTNSEFLAKEALPYNPQTFFVGQGFDHRLYDKGIFRPAPSDIASIPGPVIGYTGALLSLRLDPEIISLIAREHPEWSVVLIGPEDETFRKSDLHLLPNIHFLGPKRPEELPAYIDRFDVSINPQVVNEVTRGNYPRKIDEYLALGKPVVATNTEAMAMFSSFVYLAKVRDEFPLLIAHALSEKSPEMEVSRIAFALSHTWENNVVEIYRTMEKTMKLKIANN
jgi:teichuronic acid biosynthesis glycosyltransferase TuaH